MSGNEKGTSKAGKVKPKYMMRVFLCVACKSKIGLVENDFPPCVLTAMAGATPQDCPWADAVPVWKEADE